MLEQGAAGEVYNIGGSNEHRNIEIVRTVLRMLGKPESLIRYVPDRLGHDRRYAIDAAKITLELGWTPAYTFEEGIAMTIRWYLEHGEWLENIRHRQTGGGSK
ncbi:dTDP-glucose 4,6-dehydratase [compost metagenome]